MMYKVVMQEECSCFLKSEYEREKEFATQKEAYEYSKILAELMNEEFCKRHLFYSQIAEGNNFVIRVDRNATFVSGCSTGVTCDVGCGSTDDWTLEATATEDESCGSGCGCV